METVPVITRTTRIWIEADGIVRVELLAGAEERLEDAQRNVGIVNTLTNFNPPLLLVDIRKMKSMERSAREYYARAPASKQANRALALLVDSTVSRVIGNFFIGSSSNIPTPIRMFTDETAALAWLKGFST